MDRRDFLKKTVTVAGGIAASRLLGETNVLAAGRSISNTDPIMDYATLNNGIRMPILGYGTLRIPVERCAECVSEAIRKGWRLIDTAKNYANETEVGKGIRQSGIDRKELFVTSKLWFKDYGYESAKRAFDATLDRLGLDYLDLYLLHQPFGDVYGAWKALEELYAEGRIRAIGVSNFHPDRIVDMGFVNQIMPAVNQIEFSPYFQRWEDKRVNDQYGVQVESWGPFVSGSHPELFSEPVLQDIGKKYGKTPAQVILRYLTQQGVVTVCKTERPERMIENIGVFDFKLSGGDMAQIAKLDKGRTMSKDHRAPEDVKWFHTSGIALPDSVGRGRYPQDDAHRTHEGEPRSVRFRTAR